MVVLCALFRCAALLLAAPAFSIAFSVPLQRSKQPNLKVMEGKSQFPPDVRENVVLFKGCDIDFIKYNIDVGDTLTPSKTENICL